MQERNPFGQPARQFIEIATIQGLKRSIIRNYEQILSQSYQPVEVDDEDGPDTKTIEKHSILPNERIILPLIKRSNEVAADKHWKSS